MMNIRMIIMMMIIRMIIMVMTILDIQAHTYTSFQFKDQSCDCQAYWRDCRLHQVCQSASASASVSASASASISASVSASAFRERKAFGSPLLDNQYIHFRLAELLTEVPLLIQWKVLQKVLASFVMKYWSMLVRPSFLAAPESANLLSMFLAFSNSAQNWVICILATWPGVTYHCLQVEMLRSLLYRATDLFVAGQWVTKFREIRIMNKD